MKNLFLILVLSFTVANAQTVLWKKQFDIHSLNSLGGLSQNTIKDIDNNLIVAVVELDLLNLYKLDSQGNVLSSLNTNQECGFYTQIIKMNTDDFVMIYNNTPTANNETFKLIHFNKFLEINEEIDLNIPISTPFNLSSFFIHNNQIYITGFTDFAHIIYYLDTNNNLILKHISFINNAMGEEISFLENGNFLFDFVEGNSHQLRCISSVDGQLVWDKYFINNDVNTQQLKYKTITDLNDNIYFAGLERTLDSDQQNDIINLKKLHPASGNVILDTIFVPLNNCMQDFHDFKFNPVNNHFYLSYRSCLPNENTVLVELDSNFNFINQVLFPYQEDSLEFGPSSTILCRANGNIIFVYTEFKDTIENGNLYVVNLNSNLSINSVVELNITPKNGSEAYSDFLFYDNSKFVITGIVPNTNPSIWLEEVQHYVAMIDLDALLTVEIPALENPIAVYPNPAQNILNIQTQEIIKEINVYDVLGKKVKVIQVSINSIDVSTLAQGMYIIKVLNDNDKLFSSKFIKE